MTGLGLLDAPLELRIEAPGRPPSPNATRRHHWSKDAGAVKALRRDVFLLATDARNRSGRADDYPLGRAELALTFRLVRMAGDLDNLLAGSKPIIDGLADAGVIRGDSVATVVRITLEAERAKVDSVVVVVREVL